jgi:hypothetical protein
MCVSLIAIDVEAQNSAYSSVDGVLFNKNQSSVLQCPGAKAGSYVVPETVTNINYAAFYWCTNLTQVTLGIKVITIGSQAFQSCYNLTSIVIPEGVASIGSDAFAACHSLNAVTVPSTVTNIGKEAFGGPTSLTGIMVNPSNTVYSSVEGVLFNKSRAILIQYPGGKTGPYVITNSTTSVADEAFGYCAGLSAITFSTSITSIGSGAFIGCASLSNVIIPNSVTNIGIAPFPGCTSLNSITVDSSNPNYSSADGALFDKNFKTLIQCPAGLTGKYTVPNTVTGIAVSAFYGCSLLTTVTTPGTVTNIADQAFILCTSLSAVYFQGNAPKASSSAFAFANNAFIYYLPGTIGWGPTLAGRPTALWNPQFQIGDSTFGVQNNQFGFTVTGTTNIPIVLEATTALASPLWATLQTCTLTNGSIYFTDPTWTNYPSRFYRIRSP